MGNYQVRFRGRGRGQSYWEPSPLPDELYDDEDTLFGLADLGFGDPEVGPFSLSEIAAVRLPFGLSIERDLYFSSVHPPSRWAGTARTTGSITAAEVLLARLRHDELPPPD